MSYAERKRMAVENVGQLLEQQRNRADDDTEARLDLAIEDREEIERYADNDVFSELESISPGHRRAVESVREILRQRDIDREDADAFDASDASDTDDDDVFAE